MFSFSIRAKVRSEVEHSCTFPAKAIITFVFFLLNMSNMLMEQTELSKIALSCGLLCDGAAQRQFEFEAPDLWFDCLTLFSAKKKSNKF